MSGPGVIVPCCCLLLLLALPLAAEESAGEFDRWFVDRTLRVDYFHIGNADEETVTLDRVYDQGPWPAAR